ncbi:peptidase G2 autoproteolytic cleavage domain-containing protein [Hyphomonas sp.]|uniref:peptidase G2 autoproteolytic cleavage domain-containing protein n=1 Tax=Hyphomonas sp. TaxID=87 RepID=UPI000C992B0B|nr:peptidase G2 autoproteolytic cleavage domain-containing protein [Hyphomonas sp.]MAL42718.1 hypothetical protein [Hyphomonas sp.]
MTRARDIADRKLADNDSLAFGTGTDLTINHDGNNSFITDSGDGALYIQGTSGVFIRSADGGENLASFTDDGSVELYHDNTKRIETTSVGIGVDQIFGLSDTDTGFALGANGANIMQLYTANTERVNIDASGNTLLTCAAGDSNQALKAYHPTSTSSRDIAKFQSNVGSTQADVVTIGCDGGIEAIGEITTTNSLSQNSNSIRTAIGNDGGSATFGTSTNHQIKLFTNNTNVATLTTGGALLINQTTNPAGNMFRVTETAGNSTTTIMTTSTSYATTLEGGFVQRAGNSAYSFQLYYSSGGGNLKFNFRGDGEAFADGSFTGGGADYAEYFEWEDGNSSNEDRRGYSVVLVNNKIRKATSSDAAADIIGVVSANPSAVGDAAWNNWSGKYLRDDFGSYVIETHTSTKWSEDVTDEDGIVTTKQRDYETDQIPSDVTVPADAVVYTKDDKGNILTRRKINPDYDETLTYLPRENRQEWDTIGMVGKLRLRVGQPTGDRWIKMRDVSESVEEWLVR